VNNFTDNPLMPPNAKAPAAASDDALGLSTPEELGLEPVRHERFAERVYESLFHAIMTGKLAPDTRLPRPVVRQALDRLRQDRLIESIRGSGTYVRATDKAPDAPTHTGADMGYLIHGLELRLVIEPECAYLAALRRTKADLDNMARMLSGFENAAANGDVAHHFDFGFHEAIAQASANPRMAQVLKSLEYDVSHAINLWRHMAQLKPWRRTQDAIGEHRAIYELIQQQDAEGARRAMRSHVEKARIRMLDATPDT
jgi:GntR family transcriptional repressor for pyruvate dehydrogenase complex